MSAVLKNWPVKGLSGRCLFVSGPLPSPRRFLFGVVKHFCRFGIWSNTLLYMLSTQLDTLPPPPPSPCYKLYKYIGTTVPVLIHSEGREGEEVIQ
jgi:hypothetical protein